MGFIVVYLLTWHYAGTRETYLSIHHIPMHIAFLLLVHAFIHVLVSPAINDMEDVSYIAAEHRVVASFSTNFLKLNIFISYHSMNQNTHQTPRVLHMCFIYYSSTDNILNTSLTAYNS